VATVAAAIALADFADAQVELVVHDQQPGGRGTPAFDRFHHDLTAVVHKTAWQDEARAAHRDRDQARRGAQTHQLGSSSDGAGTKVVARPRVLSLGVPQADGDSRRGVARGESVSRRHVALIITAARARWAAMGVRQPPELRRSARADRLVPVMGTVTIHRVVTALRLLRGTWQRNCVNLTRAPPAGQASLPSRRTL